MDIDYGNYHRDSDYQKLESTFRNIFKSRLNLILPLLVSRKPNLRVLDIGCNNGVFLDLFKQKGCETWGVEPSVNAKIAASKGHKILESYFETVKLQAGYFDLVILNHTLEHVDEPVKVLQKVYRLLADGGILYVDVPNAGGLSARLMGKHWPYLAPDEHKWQFTKQSLGKVFKKSGFEVTLFKSRSGIFEYANPSLELWRKRFFLDILFSPYSFIVSFLNIGDSMSMIGIKK
jgi:SAM-dependent methyltransferase